jgi:hypothetical protein
MKELQIQFQGLKPLKTKHAGTLLNETVWQYKQQFLCNQTQIQQLLHKFKMYCMQKMKD